MSTKDLDRWKTIAMALGQSEISQPRVPIAVLVLEAEGVAKFMIDRWEPTDRLPGLSVAESRLPKKAATDITSLAAAVRSAQIQALFPGETTADPELIERGAALLRVLGAAMEFVLDDDVQEPADDAFAAAKQHAQADTTMATFLLALEEHASLAEQLQDRLATLGDFDKAWIKETRDIARTLSAKGPPKTGAEASSAIDLRNRLATLLSQRINQVRRAARYVYRDHPEIQRLVTSTYERNRRLENKREKAKKEGGGGAPVTG